MWRDFISVKTCSGWETETETLCTELAVHIRGEPESLAAKCIFQSVVFRSNLAGWQTALRKETAAGFALQLSAQRV
jgi:hypothetical protein